jgi:apolipoprotein N-acyltransferase
MRSAECGVRSAASPSAARQINRTALYLSLAAGILLWASFPPLNWWPLAWIAPVPWLCLVRMSSRFTWRTYAWIYLGGLVHWLAMLQGIRLAHWALVFGWITLAWYLAFYTPVLVWLCRVAVQRLRVPLVAAAPVVWVGLELVRGHFVTGFSAGLLGHTQVAWTSLLQIADIVGAYGVSLVLAIGAAAIAQMLPAAWLRIADEPGGWRLWPAIPAAACLAGVLAYGYCRLAEAPPRARETPLRVALIQGSLDTVFDVSEKEYQERVTRTFRHYDELTAQAIAAPGRLDLIVWPESMFAQIERRIVEPLQVPPGLDIDADTLREQITAAQEQFEAIVHDAAASINDPARTNVAPGDGTYFLFGTTTLEYGPPQPRHFNSALLADSQGRVVDRYYKTHPVMFGEYIPFGEWFPWIYDLTPLPGGLDRGPGPAAMEVAGKRLSPCICFENVVPHLVRNQVLELTRRGTPPDMLVTITNDGWFYGSSILDLHFRCAVFRAIENRRPMLIAANTGFSAHIDGCGRMLSVGPRRAPETLIVDVAADGRVPPYHTVGDWPAILCAVSCGLLAVGGCWPSRTSGTTAGKE